MPVYISMLRGVNVGPHNRMKMDQLRTSFEALGFEQVRTYGQSGNAIFRTSKKSLLGLSKRIEERILADFGFAVPVITKTREDVGCTINANPFLTERGTDLSKLHVTFLSQAPLEAALKKLTAVDAGLDKFHHAGGAIYLHCSKGYSDTKLSNNFIEKTLGISATTRNWKTVNTLYEMASECS
jgi:uncharacterized protein (DUF1697 family)